MRQVIELDLGFVQLAVFVAELYKQGLRYEFEQVGGGLYRFVITGH